MQIRQTVYNDEQMTESNSLAKALLQNPAKISPMITYLGGREDEKFPLTTLTEGVGNTKSIDRSEYEYDVKTRINKTRPVAETPSTTTGVGRGGEYFEVDFPDRWFIKDYVLVSESGVQARIMDQPSPNGDNWTYTLQLVGPDPNATVPSGDLQAGSKWGQLFAPVGKDFSRGNASNWTAPAQIRHKLTKIRKSYEFSGEANNYVVDIELPTRSGSTNMWMDHEEWQHFLSWKEENEMYYWYGQKSYNADGITQLTDERGQPINIGPGLLEQIVNKDTYSSLTATKLHNVVGDLFYGMTDAQEKQVTLFTGTGGMREFDNALKNETNNLGFMAFDEGTFVQGGGNSNLTFGDYFRTYKHVDGHTINVVKVPLFDQGAFADARRDHPSSGYSIESYRMVFVDQSTYKGENNVQMINREGEEMKRWAVAGATVPRGFGGEGNSLRASDIDGASVHFLKQCGICLKRFDTSLDLQCVAT